MVDLRDRDSFEQIAKSLSAVPAESYHDLAKRLNEIAAVEAGIDKEGLKLTTKLSETEARSRMAKCGKSTGVLRLHAFSVLGSKSYTFRLNGEESGESYCFSDFISRVDITVSPSGEALTWTRADDPVDGISITRANTTAGSQIEAVVHVNYKNCIYPVPGWLLGNPTGTTHHLTFVDLFKAICGYIKLKNLSSNDDPSYFTPDVALHDLLYPNHPRELPVSFASLLEVIRARFKVPGPFKITHKIGSVEQVFDLIVQLPDTFDDTISSRLEDADKKLFDKLLEIDAELASVCSNVKGTAQDTKFADKLIANPVGFLGDIIKMPTGAPVPVESVGLVDYLNMTTSHEFYKQPWAVAAAAYVVNEQKKESST
jgi:hypothetical protein